MIGEGAMRGIFVAAALVAVAYGAAAAEGNRMPGFGELKASAERNNPVAQNNLAVRYATGEGVKQDYAQAAIWYQRAGEQGYAIAQYNLGALYEHGMGVPVDLGAAKVWYELAAQQGDGWAQLSLGQLLAAQGDAPAAAYKWLYLAAVGDDPEAKPAAAAGLKKVAPKLSAKQLAEVTAEIKAWRPVKNQ